MTLTIQATYENGVLRPAQPLPLREQEQVRIIIQSELGWAERSAGLLRWTGDVETLDRFIMDPELDPQEGP